MILKINSNSFLYLILILISPHLFSQSNLSSFEITTDKGIIFKGYAEPKNPLTDENSTIKSRIFLFPQIIIDENSLVVRNVIGNKVDINNYSNFEKLTARINLELKATQPTEEELLVIISQINPGIQKPMSLDVKPIHPTNTGNGNYSQKINIYNDELKKWENSRKDALNYLKGYQIVPVNPRSLEFNVIVNGESLKTHKLTSNSTVGSGTFQINIPFSDELFYFRLLLEQDYLIQSDFKYLTSKFQSASAIKDLNTFVNYSAEQFRNEIVKARSSSSGFLFWKTTRRSIKRYVEEQSSQNLSSGSVSRFEYTVYDGDENLIKQVDNFLFPELTLTETIKNHLNAAQEAIDKGDEEMAKIHTDYAQFLQDGATNLGDLNHIDALGALTSLSQGNIAAFLAQGVAFNTSNSVGNFTFRRSISGSLTQSDTRQFNALIFKSLFENHLFTTTPKPNKKISQKFMPEPLKDRFVFVKGGKFDFGKTVNHPNFTASSSTFAFDFSNDSYTADKLTEVKDFWIGKYEVTQAEWSEIMNYNNSEFKGNNLPVTNITWIEALQYCNKLSDKYGLEPVYSIILDEVKIRNTANGFRLPTAQEWEFAAKGGQHSKGFYFSGSNNVDEVAWYQENTLGTQNVGRKKSNELGIFDMSGNVIEWCFNSKSDLPLQSGEIHVENSLFRKITKGGSYRTYDSRLTPWSSSFYFYDQKFKWIGFRVLLHAAEFSSLKLNEEINKNTIKELNKSLDKEGNNPDVYYNLGVVNYNKGDLEKAKLYYEKALQIDDTHVKANLNLAVLILSKENGIINEMNSLGRSEAENIRYEFLNNKRIKLYKSVIPYLEKVIEFESNNLSAKNTLYNIYKALGENDKAKSLQN